MGNANGREDGENGGGGEDPSSVRSNGESADLMANNTPPGTPGRSRSPIIFAPQVGFHSIHLLVHFIFRLISSYLSTLNLFVNLCMYECSLIDMHLFGRDFFSIVGVNVWSLFCLSLIHIYIEIYYLCWCI